MNKYIRLWKNGKELFYQIRWKFCYLKTDIALQKSEKRRKNVKRMPICLTPMVMHGRTENRMLVIKTENIKCSDKIKIVLSQIAKGIYNLRYKVLRIGHTKHGHLLDRQQSWCLWWSIYDIRHAYWFRIGSMQLHDNYIFIIYRIALIKFGLIMPTNVTPLLSLLRTAVYAKISKNTKTNKNNINSNNSQWHQKHHKWQHL